jgi:dihydrodipicolinate synthase/N-acetylneuraminate lyase
MRPFSATEIRGSYATLLLPIREDESIDYSILNDQLQYLVAADVDGIYSNGTAGEFYSLSEIEFVDVNQLLTETCEKARLPFQISAAFPTAQLALQRARRAAEFKPSAIQVILPDWYPPTLDEAIEFLKRAEEVTDGVPLVLYNPPHAKKVLNPAELKTVCDRVTGLVGLKTGAGDAAWYEAMQPVIQRISVFVPGHTLASGLALGASGSYSNVSCLQPRGAARWNRLIENNLTNALEVEKQIQTFMTNRVLPFRESKGRSNMALDKLLAWIGDWAPIGMKLRWPYIGIDAREVTELRAQARQEIPFLFEQ